MLYSIEGLWIERHLGSWTLAVCPHDVQPKGGIESFCVLLTDLRDQNVCLIRGILGVGPDDQDALVSEQ